ncbi:MAG: FimB/Mfa2 family fimbrial subunit [Muribaculaceae bacterium]|nr:FimB/Mfa2 family fimbrial subunit [Muribaculaceae bacterium]
MKPLNKKLYGLLSGLAICFAVMLSSCDRLHEDLEPCPSGVRLRFVYDYNMEFANAFPSQVDCLTLLIYDKEGNYLRTEIASAPMISDENWRMTLDLPSGEYRLLAYGGMECEQSSFSFIPLPEKTSEQGLEVAVKPEYLSPNNDKPMHNLFYGALSLSIPPAGNGTTYTEATVEMIKDTNDIRILLGNERGLDTDADDFEFTITDNNSILNSANLPASDDMVTYYPWHQGTVMAGFDDEGRDVRMAVADLCTSRLMVRSGAKLLVKRISDGKEIVRLPLVNVLLLLRSERFRDMKPQEFLDRQSRWNLTFFLTGEGEWLKTEIKINEWIVRINNIEEW